MVDQTRLQEMIRLAEYENGEGKNALKIRGYYRNDYIALGLIKTFFLTTIGYVLLLGLIAAANLEFLLDTLSLLDPGVLITWLIIGYAVMMIVYLTVSFFRSSLRYREAKKSVRRYEEELLRLDKLYRRKKG